MKDEIETLAALLTVLRQELADCKEEENLHAVLDEMATVLERMDRCLKLQATAVEVAQATLNDRMNNTLMAVLLASEVAGSRLTNHQLLAFQRTLRDAVTRGQQGVQTIHALIGSI